MNLLSRTMPDSANNKKQVIHSILKELPGGNVLFQKIFIPLPGKVFWFESPTPLEIPVKLHTFP